MSAFATELGAIANPQVPTWGQMYNNLQTYRNFQAQNAISGIYQQSIDPTTGAFDAGKFNALIAQSPQAAWAAGPAMQQAGTAMAAQGQGQQAQTGATLQRLQALSGMATPLMLRAERGEPVSSQDVMGVVQQGQASGLLSPSDVQRAQRVLTQPGANPTEVLLGWQFANQHAQEQQQALLPNYTPMNLGGRVQMTQANPWQPNYGQPTGLSYGLSMTPAQAATPVELQIGNNQTIQVPLGNLPNVLAANPAYVKLNPGVAALASIYGMPPGGGAGGRGPITNNAFGPGYTGTYPTQGGNAANAPTQPTGGAPGPPVTSQPLPPPAPAAPPAGGATPPTAPAAPAPPTASAGQPAWLQPPPPAPTGGAYGGVGVTASPEVQSQQTAQGTQSQAQLTSLQQQVQMVPQTRALLADMRSEEATAGFQGGIGAQTASTFNKVLQFAHLSDQGNYDTSTPQAAREAFRKDSSLLAQTQLKALGNSSAITDARQELTEASTPTVEMSDAGRRLLIHTLSGNQTAVQVVNDSWQRAQAQGWGPAQFSQWMQTFNATDKATGGQFDPRVMWLADMTPQEQWEYGHKMMGGSNADAMQFSRNLDYAERMGWISVSNTGNVSLGAGV